MNVPRWAFTDTRGLLAPYVFPINPNTMTSPFARKSLRTATAINGVVRALQAPRSVHEWTFGGIIHDQAHYEALQTWAALGHRVLVTDHLARTWPCELVEFAPTPVRSRRPWKHTYSMRALVYGGPS